MPLWLALISLAYIFLIYLYTKIFKQTIDLAEKQSQDLKQKVDMIDKTTSIFERTVLNQEKDIEKLKRSLKEKLKKLQKAIEYSKKLEEDIKENTNLEKKCKELYFLYSNILPIIILSEEIFNNIEFRINKELSGSFAI